MMPSSGHRKLLNAASTRSGLAIHKMNTASRGKSPPKSAKRQPIASSSLSRCLAASGGGGRHVEMCAARPCEIPSWLAPPRRHYLAGVAVSMACSSSASSASSSPISTRSRGLMNPSESRNPPARAIALRSGTAHWCSISTNAAAESLGMSSSTSQASSSSKTWRPSAAASAPASAPFSRPASPSMPRPMRAPTLLPSSTASSVVRLLRWATSSSPWGSLWTARASITRTVSLSRSRSSSVMISPWKLGWLNPKTINCTGPMAMATPSLFPALRSDRVAQLAAVGGHGPDDEDVQGDDEQRPERVVGDEGEVGDGAEHGQDDRHRARPGPPRQQPPAGEGHQQAEDQVGPAPGGGVELEEVVAGGDVELVLEDGDEPLDGLEHPGHDHHDRREQDEPDGRPARLPLGATGSGRRVRLVGHLLTLLLCLIRSGGTSVRAALLTARSHRTPWRSSSLSDESCRRGRGSRGRAGCVRWIPDGHCLAMAMWSRSSGVIRWSASAASSSRSIWTQLTSPVNSLPRGP